MNKQEIHRCLVDQAKIELESITISAKSSFSTATSDQHRAEGKYDTFKLESSFLSRGLARRVAELTTAMEALQGIPLPDLNQTSPVQIGALAITGGPMPTPIGLGLVGLGVVLRIVARRRRPTHRDHTGDDGMIMR